MDQRDIDDLLVRHRRQTWLPWLCICGLRHTCGARRVAIEERIKLETRARMAIVMERLRAQAARERALAQMRIDSMEAHR